ncbi:MAG TPA: hypothetical protein VH619_18310 [Verrucomicrobiae bacterium]|jgi:hypothetical protein|nr:hypothetical protein [Verrucomicrobiae bacterium]
MKFHQIKVGVAVALVAVFAGCVGYVDGGYDDGGGVVVEGPGLWGGPFYRGHDVHAFSHRGFVSRGIAHGGGGRRR